MNCTGSELSKSFKEAQYNEKFMGFDLLKLAIHESNNSVVYFKGDCVREIFSELIEECYRVNDWRQADICKYFCKLYSCDRTTVAKFIKWKDFFPVHFVKDLLSILPPERYEYFAQKFIESVQFFKFGTSSDWTVFPKELSSELSWLCGAIAADGWITKEKKWKERLGIVDQNEKMILRAANYFKIIFDYTPRVYRHSSKDCLLLIVDSKAIIKFFLTYLGFGYGYKTETIDEPAIIKNSKYRLDYAKGVLCFDGSVELDGTISLGVKSKSLSKSIYEILAENGFPMKFSKPNDNLYFIRSSSLLFEKDAPRWVNIFGKETEKGYRLYSLIFGFEHSPDNTATAIKSLVKFANNRKIEHCKFESIIAILQNRKEISKTELLDLAGVAHATLFKYIWILRKANIVTYDNSKFGRGIYNVYKFNSNSSEWKIPNS